MICKTKNREQYTALFQAMTSKMPELKSSLRAFGQDGENAILEVHTMEFPFSVGFKDSVHIKRNIEEQIKTNCIEVTSFSTKFAKIFSVIVPPKDCSTA